MERIELDHIESVAHRQITNALHLVIFENKFCVFPKGATRFGRDFFYNCLSESGIVKPVDTHINANNLKLNPSKWWDVIYDPLNPNVYAHSKTRQPLHTDNAFLTNPPEISLFAMGKQAEVGGESTLLSFEKLVDNLTCEAPDLYYELTNTIVRIRKGDDVEPNICKIINPEKGEINWNYYRTERSSANVEKMVEAFFQFLERLEEQEKIDIVKFDTGDVYLFNDLKFLHARKSFEASKYGDRVLSQSMWRIV